MAGRKELFCASTSPVIISALHITPAAPKQFLSSSLSWHEREELQKIVSASSRHYMAGWKYYWTSRGTEKLHLLFTPLVFVESCSCLVPIYIICAMSIWISFQSASIIIFLDTRLDFPPQLSNYSSKRFFLFVRDDWLWSCFFSKTFFLISRLSPTLCHHSLLPEVIYAK